MRTSTAIGLAVAAVAAGIVLSGRREQEEPMSKGSKPPAKKARMAGYRTEPHIAAELARINARLAALGVNTSRHDAYELLRMPKVDKLGPDGSRAVAIPEDEYVDNLAALFVQVVQPIEAMIGGRVVVRGAYRAPDYNLQVGGKPTSDHTRGRAADLDLADLAKLKLAQAKFYVQHPELPLEFGWYAGNTHVGLGGDHETYSGAAVPGEDDKWIAKAKKELGIA